MPPPPMCLNKPVKSSVKFSFQQNSSRGGILAHVNKFFDTPSYEKVEKSNPSPFAYALALVTSFSQSDAVTQLLSGSPSVHIFGTQTPCRS